MDMMIGSHMTPEKIRLCAALLFSLLAATAASGAASAEAFNISELPVGKNVTLLKPATTTVPLWTRTTLGPTDLPQILKFEVVGNGSAPGTEIKLAIYDATQKRVRYVKVRHGVPFLYNFADLDAIMVIPEGAASKDRSEHSGGLTLQVESDKPLSVGR
jgi:hypothetical protein